MGSLGAHAQFERARWRLRFLLPLWALQLSLTLGMAGMFAYRLGDSLKHYAERDEAGELPKLEIVWESTNIGLSAVSTMCTLTDIAKFIAEVLTPWTVLFTHVITLTCAIAILVVDLVVHSKGIDGHYSIIGLALDGVLLCTAAALAIYAIVAYRRLSAQGDHSYILDVKGYGFRDGLERGTSYSSQLGARPGLEKRISSASSRLSFTSMRSEQAADAVPMGPIRVERTVSVYSHERDTQFDDYLARRESVGSKADVERAMGAEFGWYSTPEEKSADSEGTFKMGVVRSRPRGPSAPRAPSLTSDHVLLAVPEAEEDEPTAGHRRADQDAKDREALLGGDRRDSEEDVGARMPQEVDIVEPRWQRE